MTLPIDTLSYKNNLRSLPPEQKLLFALVVLGIALIASPLTQVLIILWLAIWTIGYAKIPIQSYFKLLGVSSLFLAMGLPALVINMIVANQIDLVATDQLGGIQLGGLYFYLSHSGWQEAGKIFIRSLACISCLLFMLLTIPFIEIVQTLRRCQLPETISDLLMLMYRFVFMLINTVIELRLAQQARGGYRTWKLAVKSTSLLVSQLLQRTIIRYQQFCVGLAARGFTDRFYWFNEQHRKYSQRYALEGIIGCLSLSGLDLYLRVS
ncbi:MAG: cobalt ECF transporter T component CbiQ [Coleofasciculus sp. G3-WIS-01]|uniref:cobalt ECF transporter T component CbiQ n=1 Tax=Coleofasciculus sp. G3-WIS-01 TaxID=3069528 RepID=UPI0032FE2A15